MRLSETRHSRLRLPPTDQLLNHALVWLAIILVVGAVAFGVYYYYDRQVGDTGEDPLTHQIGLFEQAVQDDPTLLGPRLGLGDLYFRVGRFPESAAQYEAALGIDDKNVLAMWGVGRALYAEGDLQGAEQSFQRIIDMSNEADVRGDLVGASYYYKGRIALDRNDPAAAIENLEKAAKIDRSDADSIQMLGTAYVANGRYDEGIAELNKAIRFVPEFPEAYASLAVAYEGKGMATEAKWARAMKLFAEGNLGKAAKELEAVTAALPEWAPGWTGLGLTREKQGKREEAAKAYGKAATLDPQDFNAVTGLARMGLGQPSSEGFHGVGTQQTPEATGGGQ